MPKIKGLDFAYDKIADVATIEGVRYSGSFFRHLGEHGWSVGIEMRLEERKNGEIYLKCIGGKI